MKFLIAFILVLSLSACSTQIMQSYVGKDITEAILDYGHPSSVIDLPDGTRAFQWQFTSTGFVPSTYTYSGYTYGGMTTGTIQSYGGYSYEQTCLYTLIGNKNSQNSYTIINYREPTFMC